MVAKPACSTLFDDASHFVIGPADRLDETIVQTNSSSCCFLFHFCSNCLFHFRKYPHNLFDFGVEVAGLVGQKSLAAANSGSFFARVAATHDFRITSHSASEAWPWTAVRNWV